MNDLNKLLGERNGHDTELERKIFEQYRKIKKEKKDVCKDCEKEKKLPNSKHPVSIFVVGKNFRNEKYKVMFVGKTVLGGWNTDPKDSESSFVCAKTEGFLPFWSATDINQCIKEVCQKLWLENDAGEIWNKIAFTNIVKCTTSEETDKTPATLKNNCILKARFFEKEVEVIKPTHIIFFTSRSYDKYIDKLDFGYRFKNVTNRTHKKEETIWWHRQFLTNGKVKMHFLRVYHPGFYGRKSQEAKENFAENIANWIKKNRIE